MKQPTPTKKNYPQICFKPIPKKLSIPMPLEINNSLNHLMNISSLSFSVTNSMPNLTSANSKLAS